MARRPAKQNATDMMRSPEFVRLALSGVEREIEAARERLSTLNAYADQLRGQLRGKASPAAAPVPAAPASAPAKRSHRLSADARKKLSERMRKKWAEYRKNKNGKSKPSA